MATRRQLIYEALIGWGPLMAIPDLTPAKVIQASRMVNIPEPPFVTFRMHHALQHQGRIGRRDFVSVWAHDEPGDYMRIDTMIEQINLAVQAIGHGFEWFEESVDLQDDDMHTITRNTRFTITSSTPERH
jgi:hypothetical protein